MATLSKSYKQAIHSTSMNRPSCALATSASAKAVTKILSKNAYSVNGSRETATTTHVEPRLLTSIHGWSTRTPTTQSSWGAWPNGWSRARDVDFVSALVSDLRSPCIHMVRANVRFVSTLFFMKLIPLSMTVLTETVSLHWIVLFLLRIVATFQDEL